MSFHTGKADMADSSEPQSKASGLRRVWNAFTYSLKGLRFAAGREPAFQQQLILFIVAWPFAIWLGDSVGEVAILMLPLVLSLIVELLNTAIECLADEIGRDQRFLLGAAKDCGSAAVFLCLMTASVFWIYVLVEKFS